MTNPTYRPTDRRPIASRNLALSRWAAHRLAAAGVSPNAISVFGMLAAFVAGGLLASTAIWPEYARAAWLLAAVCVQTRLLANMLDGMVAVERGIASPLGELFNEVPDRLSDVAVLVGLGYAAGGHLLWGFGAALAALFTAYVRAAAKVAGAPQDYCGPMAKAQRMFVVTLAAVYLGLSPLAWQPEFSWAGGGVATLVLMLITLGSLLTALRRLWRAAAFLSRGAA